MKKTTLLCLGCCVAGLLFSGCAPQHYNPPPEQPSGEYHQHRRPQHREQPSAPPSHQTSFQQKAYEAMARKDYRTAETMLERGIRNDPRNSGLWYDLARVKYLEGQYRKSAQLGKKALSLSRNHGEQARIKALIDKAHRRMQY